MKKSVIKKIKNADLYDKPHIKNNHKSYKNEKRLVNKELRRLNKLEEREEKEKAYQERLKERKKNGGLAMNQPTEKQIKFAEDIANTLDIMSVDFRAMSYEEVTEFITENKDDYYQRRYDNN